jgi:acetoin utilization protein AcuB
MLASQIITTYYPAINLYDKVSFALQLMDDFDILHLPVISEEKYVGLVRKDDLLDADEDNLIAVLEQQLIKALVKGEEHFTVALKLITEQQISMIAVVNEQHELTGTITANDLLRQVAHFLGTDEVGGVIVLEMDRRNYSFGEISRLVETNDAHITQLNSYTEAETGLAIVTLKINKIEVSDIVATFQRYDYNVRYYFGEEQYANELKENYNHLISYLNM